MIFGLIMCTYKEWIKNLRLGSIKPLLKTKLTTATSGLMLILYNRNELSTLRLEDQNIEYTYVAIGISIMIIYIVYIIHHFIFFRLVF